MDEISGILLSHVKYARKQRLREEYQRRGADGRKTRVLTNCHLETVSQMNKDDSPFRDSSDIQKRRRILEGYISEFCKGREDYEVLIRRRLLYREAIVEIARSEGIDYARARSIVNRFEHFAGLKG